MNDNVLFQFLDGSNITGTSTYDMWRALVNPNGTCKYGYCEKKTCTVCGEGVISDIIYDRPCYLQYNGRFGHTETEPAYYLYKCDICGSERKDYDSEINHNYRYQYVEHTQTE